MKRVVIRFVRVFVSAGISAVLSQIQNDPKLMLIAPVISALGKALREKYNLTWLPF